MRRRLGVTPGRVNAETCTAPPVSSNVRRMAPTLRRYALADEPLLQALFDEPSIAYQYDHFTGPGGVERVFADPYIPREGMHVAFEADQMIGFAYCVLLPAEPPWAMLRGAVHPSARRRGVGSALFETLERYVRTQSIQPGISELAIAGWEPLDAVRHMAESRGYTHERWLWLMERPRGMAVPEPTWPAGVSVRALDGSDAMLADWNDAYNQSFAEHYRYVPSPLEHVHELAAAPGFRPDGILLAYRDGQIAGFCRTEQHGDRGEIGTLGTSPGARGIGLGRALLRWGVDWLEHHTPGAITLMVDGNNEGALGLYRSEGFNVTRTRGLWKRLEPRA